MEYARALSLSDEVLSQCQLLNTEFSLLSTPVGVRLKWSCHNEERKVAKISTCLVANTKTSGRLYPIQLNEEMEVGIFGRKSGISSGQLSKCCAAVIVALDTGALMAAHTKFPGTLSILCHPEEAVVWSGVVKGKDDRCAIVVISKAGIIYIGLPRRHPKDVPAIKPIEHRKCNLSWHEEKLQNSPLACQSHDNVILISDGISLLLSVVNFLSDSKVCHKTYKLPYYGVVKIASVTDDKLCLTTCDGRTYEKTWKCIVKSIDKEKTPKPPEPELVSSVKEVLTGIQHCSEMVQAEGSLIHDLDIYMSQLSLAASLLAEPQRGIFSGTAKIEQQLEQKGYYMAHLKLKKNISRIHFEGKWWLLNVTVPINGYKESLCIKLDGQHLNREINVSVPLPDLITVHSLSGVKIVCHLLLGHFTTFQPVCQVLACCVNIDIFHFLSDCHELTVKDVRISKFSTAIQSFAVKRNLSETTPAEDLLPVQPCQVKLSFIDNNVNRQLFLMLLNRNSIMKCNVSSLKDSNQVQLWYHDIPIDLHYSLLDKKIIISVSGPDSSVVLAVKVAIERQITENGSVPSSISLSADVFEEAQNSCQMLEFESSKAITQVAMNHLYKIVTKTLCNIPL
ncbi:uncharacterized protein [Macrobrachium rosenbergii]|uniref:uncharacterized protein isoform X2 n=1 Tax=Macrobrachium rosenbergii TaxID=79674 RepID=UPI0034D50159